MAAIPYDPNRVFFFFASKRLDKIFVSRKKTACG